MVCRRAVLKLALGLSLTSVTSPAYAEGTPAREPLPTTTADLVARLRGDVEGRRFIGDIGFGVRMPNGTLINLFGDTVVTPTGNPAYPGALTQQAYVMRNSAIVMLPTGGIRSALTNARLLAKRSLVDVPPADELPGGQNFYGPLSAVVTKDLATGTDLVLLFLAQMYDRNLKQLGSSDPTWDFAQVSSRLATYSVAADGSLKLVSLTRTPMAEVAPGAVGWGAGAFATSDYLFVFGSRKLPDPYVFGSDYYLARVPLKSRTTASAWRFWTGSGWSTDKTRAAVVIPGSVGVESTIAVRQDTASKGFTFVLKKDGFIGTTIRRERAASLTAPWRLDITPIGDVVKFNSTDFSYSAHEVPLGGGRIGIVISHGNEAANTPSELTGLFSVR